MDKVVIDVNSVVPYFVKGWVSGIGRTTMELVASINEISCTDIDISLFSQNMKGIGGRNMNTAFTTKHLYLPHRDKWNRWIAKTPVREWLTKYDIYHIPHNFDFVHCPDRTIITLHDALFFAFPDASFNHAFAREHYPELAKKCRAIITCSQSSKEDIMRYMSIPDEKIFVAPWGINNQMFFPNPQKKTGAPYFLMVSCKGERKNAINMIKAYEIFAKQNPYHELVLVWPSPPEHILEYCSKEPLRSHVYIETDIDDERLSRLYNEATATFFPSRYEGFGLPVVESMACGTPVVTCNNSSLREVGGDAALYVDPDDIEGMASYMEQFENGVIDVETISQLGIQQAKKFSWRECAEATLNVYRSVL